MRYDNDYCMVLRLEDGKIKEIQEYCELGPDREGARAVSADGREGRELTGLRTISSADRCRPPRSAMVVSIWRRLDSDRRCQAERSRARYQLAAMSERELQDCGMTRAEIAYELRKPVRRS